MSLLGEYKCINCDQEGCCFLDIELSPIHILLCAVTNLVYVCGFPVYAFPMYIAFLHLQQLWPGLCWIAPTPWLPTSLQQSTFPSILCVCYSLPVSHFCFFPFYTFLKLICACSSFALLPRLLSGILVAQGCRHDSFVNCKQLSKTCAVYCERFQPGVYQGVEIGLQKSILQDGVDTHPVHYSFHLYQEANADLFNVLRKMEFLQQFYFWGLGTQIHFIEQNDRRNVTYYVLYFCILP